MQKKIFWIENIFNLNNDQEDRDITMQNIKSNLSVSGSNLWILICAIFIASIWLNLNSTAVVIGAMLISPLMGPVVSAGFALWIYDFSLLRKALKNLAIATFVSILVSACYFYISPFKEVQSEILARTSPNIYDILIAFFGGIVGIIAMTRVEKGNPLPWVAIATALMPPLCTAWYGLSQWNFEFFFGAIYLYIINSVFIFLATFLLVKHLKYPLVQDVDIERKKQIKNILSIISIIMLVPSIWFAYLLFEKQYFLTTVDTFLNKEFTAQGNILFYKKIEYTKNNKKIEIAVLGKSYPEEEINLLNEKIKNEYHFENTSLVIRKTSSEGDIKSLKETLLTEIKNTQEALSNKDATIESLQKKINKSTIDMTGINEEVAILFPDIKNIYMVRLNEDEKSQDYNTFISIYESILPIWIENESILTQWLIQRTKRENIELYHRTVQE